MARFKLFGPLVRVPSAVLNRIQEGLLDWKANGAKNTMGVNLDTNAMTHDQRRVHMSVNTDPILDVMDSSIDWRDRMVDIEMWFDPAMDIRPGHAADLFSAAEYVKCTHYTGAGGQLFLLGTSVAISAHDATGNLLIVKLDGFLHIRVSSGAQIKERS